MKAEKKLFLALPLLLPGFLIGGFLAIVGRGFWQGILVWKQLDEWAEDMAKDQEKE